MPIDDLQGAIAVVRDACFYEEELEQFEKIVDRLEGYDLAYGVILKSKEELEEINVVIKEYNQMYLKEISSLKKELTKYVLLFSDSKGLFQVEKGL